MAVGTECIPENVEELRALVVSLRDELEMARRDRENGIRRLAETETLLEREKAKYEDLKREIFGRKSEKIATDDPHQGELFNEAERDGNAAPKEQPVQIVRRRVGKSGGRRRPAPELERIEKLHDLSDVDKLCPCCGGSRPRIGEERSEEVEIVPARAVVVVHVRPKYGPCACEYFEGSGAKAIVHALAPPKILPGSLFSNRSIAFFLVGKYADGLPFHRQEKVIARLGLDIARGTMARLAMRVGTAVSPILEIMQRDIRGSPVVRMDETPVQVLKEPGRRPESESRMWVAMGYREGRPILLFAYNQSRSGKVAEAILGDYQGCLQTDGYSGYTKLGERPGIMHVGCWAHIRREFHHVYESQEHSPLALEAIKLIRELYHIEATLRERFEGGTITAGEFLARRKAETAPVFAQFLLWLHEHRTQVPPRSPLGAAMTYALGQYDRATRYVEHVLMTPDNNLVENAIRPFVIGRKNWLFCDTPGGAWASATLYSLVETARANGHEPYRYLCHLFEKLPGSKSPGAIEALLPYRLKPTEY
jgi:transposase